MGAETRAATTYLPASKLLHPQHQRLRAELDQRHIDDMRECLADLPAVLVFHDGQRHWIADGEHHVHACAAEGKQVLCEVRKGTRHDAVMEGLARHRLTYSLPWRSADKRHAALLLLKDPHWSEWNDTEIARMAGCSTWLVGVLRSREEDLKAAAKVKREEEEQAAIMTHPENLGVSPTAKAKPSFKDEAPAAPSAPKRKVKITKGKNAGREYEITVKIKKAMPGRLDPEDAREKTFRSITKLERQWDMAGIDRVAVYEALLAGAKKGLVGKEILEEFYEEMD